MPPKISPAARGPGRRPDTRGGPSNPSATNSGEVLRTPPPIEVAPVVSSDTHYEHLPEERTASPTIPESRPHQRRQAFPRHSRQRSHPSRRSSRSGSVYEEGDLQSQLRQLRENQIMLQATIQRLERVSTNASTPEKRTSSGNSNTHIALPSIEKETSSPNPPIRGSTSEIELPPIQKQRENTAFTATSESWAPKPRVELLDDGTDPTWVSWINSVVIYLEQFAHSFRSEMQRMRWIFSMTKGKANAMLAPFFQANIMEPFASSTVMITWLQDAFSDPAALDKARAEFARMSQEPGEPFFEFRTRFMVAASVGEIARSE